MKNAILNQLISYTTPAWFGQIGTICDVKTHSPHDSTPDFPIADTDSTKAIDKRARKVHNEYTRAAQTLDEEFYPATPAGSKWPIGTIVLQHGPSATHPRAHEVAGFRRRRRRVGRRRRPDNNNSNNNNNNNNKNKNSYSALPNARAAQLG